MILHEISITELSDPDQPMLQELLRAYATEIESAADDDAPARVIDLFEGNDAFLVLDDEDEPVALANLSDNASNEPWLDGLVVLPGQRGAGIGSFALTSIMKVLASRGRNSLNLRALPSAQSFYTQHGFVVQDDKALPKMTCFF